MKFNRDDYTLSDAGFLTKTPKLLAVVGLAAVVALYFVGDHHDKGIVLKSYLTSFMFWTSIGLGGLFFTMVHHLTSARWSVVIRRVSETAMATLPVMAVLFIPILLGVHEIYHWTHDNPADTLLQAKKSFLNVPFFVIRSIIYFGIWIALAYLLYRGSRSHDDDGSPETANRLKAISAPGMLLFALSITFAAFDWMMSMDHHWYSTIFGVYVFAGSFLAILSFMALTFIYLRSQGVLDKEVTVEHYHDIGKFIFAFTVFWAYSGFSQYFLIWYGNIPEETVWYLHRWEHGWSFVSMFLFFGHFVFPFLFLMSREPKRNIKAMASFPFGCCSYTGSTFTG